ncbi:MAG: type IV secretory system conjugative DNA transfer family protein [Lachnospiraceae bacterium]|nr:type IV secretory system conjugative DNA transfer family protein [Lachnospiraceae bacterium]
MDRVILGEGCFAEDGIGMARPNNNQMVVGCSGTGKSMSVMLPTILNMNESSMIGTYSKVGEARKISKYQKLKGYRTEICDLTCPEKSTVAFDPVRYLGSYLDVEDLSKNIVLADPDSKNTKDIYWNDSAVSLLSSLILATMMTEEKATMSDVLELFDRLTIEENSKGIKTSLDTYFLHIKERAGNCQAVTAFADFQQLPYGTGGCVRDSLAKALRRLFPDPIREMMRRKKVIDFKRLAREKSSLIIITSPVNVSLYLFANLLFSTAIKQLLEYAEECENQKLPRNVRLMFDDFACAARINDYSKHIAVFRAAGLSAMMLLQSEAQLLSLYPEAEAANILNNCSCYVYFPGGMDLTTCRNVSQRLDRPVFDIMYAPTGQVIVMQSGKKPVTVPRYDVMHSKEYQEFIAMG